MKHLDGVDQRYRHGVDVAWIKIVSAAVGKGGDQPLLGALQSRIANTLSGQAL